MKGRNITQILLAKHTADPLRETLRSLVAEMRPKNVAEEKIVANIINRHENEYSDGSAVFRYWDPEFIIKEFDKFVELGIKNIKIADELFVLNANHFMKLCELIIERGFNFNIWCYSRVDTVKEQFLETLRKAGVQWLALGIESANTKVRKDVIKGRFEDVAHTCG